MNFRVGVGTQTIAASCWRVWRERSDSSIPAASPPGQGVMLAEADGVTRGFTFKIRPFRGSSDCRVKPAGSGTDPPLLAGAATGSPTSCCPNHTYISPHAPDPAAAPWQVGFPLPTRPSCLQHTTRSCNSSPKHVQSNPNPRAPLMPRVPVPAAVPAGCVQWPPPCGA